MAVQRVLTLGDPLLKEKSQFVPIEEIKSDAIQELIDTMIETMRHYHGVGLAAPQIGVMKSIFLMEVKNNIRYPNHADFPLKVIINPQISSLSDEHIMSKEGCLSLPEIKRNVSRSKYLVLSYYDRSGSKTTLELDDFPAIIAQHEYDHLNGILFIDRMTDVEVLSSSEAMVDE